jgi:hypothetical protein
MIATKHCDVCDTELPPCQFQTAYQCADVALHANHPNKSFSTVRITASPNFTNGDCSTRVDICPSCFLALCEKLVSRLRAHNKREASRIKNWREWRQATRKTETERAGCNEQRKA